MNALYKKLGSNTAEFGGGIRKGRAWIKNSKGIKVGYGGQQSVGVNFPSIKFSRYPKTVKFPSKSRVDIEVNSGAAFAK